MISEIGSSPTNQEDRPVFVKSTNFKNSKVLKFPDESPTDRQIKYLIRLGYTGHVPKNRLEASQLIEKCLSVNS